MSLEGPKLQLPFAFNGRIPKSRPISSDFFSASLVQLSPPPVNQ